MPLDLYINLGPYKCVALGRDELNENKGVIIDCRAWDSIDRYGFPEQR